MFSINKPIVRAIDDYGKTNVKIDLFSCGGGVLAGARSIGSSFDVAVDIDPVLTSSASHNFPSTRHVLKDLSTADEADVEDWTQGRRVELVFGGPPCQGFSLIGRREADDPRRNMLWHYFRMVSLLRPRVFVMENVAGLASPSTMPLLWHAIEAWTSDYEVLEPRILDASDYGAPTVRRRLFVVGYLPNETPPLSWEDLARQPGGPNVRDAIGDLVGARRLPEAGAPRWRLDGRRRVSSYAASLRDVCGSVDGMEPTSHTQAVLDRFSEVRQGGTDPVGRYPRLSWTGKCPTLRAGTGSDRGSHQAIRPIHPDEDRVITVREAARLQGFPDRHRFHPTKWHSFRMIGNSVAPPMAAALLNWIETSSGFYSRSDHLFAAE